MSAQTPEPDDDAPQAGRFNDSSLAWYLYQAPQNTPYRAICAAWRAHADPAEVWDQ
jgi:hypothetical protein